MRQAQTNREDTEVGACLTDGTRRTLKNKIGRDNGTRSWKRTRGRPVSGHCFHNTTEFVKTFLFTGPVRHRVLVSRVHTRPRIISAVRAPYPPHARLAANESPVDTDRVYFSDVRARRDENRRQSPPSGGSRASGALAAAAVAAAAAFRKNAKLPAAAAAAAEKRRLESTV